MCKFFFWVGRLVMFDVKLLINVKDVDVMGFVVFEC